MRRGFSLKKLCAAVLVAASLLTVVPVNSLTAKAATTVDYYETTQVNKNGTLKYKSTGNKMVTITAGSYAKNALTIELDDSDKKIKNIKCSKQLKYKRTYKKYSDSDDKVIYRYSFYTTKTKRFSFIFTVDGQEYKVIINSATPVAKATFAGKELSTKYGLGSASYVTDMKKGKFNVTMSKKFVLESIQVGKYRNVTIGKAVEPTLYWTDTKNNKKVTLSSEPQVVESSDKDTFEESMYSTTIIRVNYRYVKDNSRGCVDYYFNRIVDTDN
ncbi:MAG: hypothetical protein K6G06_03195 [Butyrivibrio sp.]|nr:hypothetical protein [Butyrivibrio sp.]